MASWVSDEKGVWHPAKEKVGLINRSNNNLVIEMSDDEGKKFKKTIKPGEPYTYEGPDRGAMLQWWEENGKPTAEQMQDKINGNVTFGDDFRKNSEFMEQYSKFRQMFGFKDVEEYLKYINHDEKAAHARFLKNASVVSTHEAPNRVKEIEMIGGGTDRANPGQNIRRGGFMEGAAHPAV